MLGDEKMNKFFLFILILLFIYPSVLLGNNGPIPQKTIEYLKHSKKKHKNFLKKNVPSAIQQSRLFQGEHIKIGKMVLLIAMENRRIGFPTMRHA